MPNGKPNILILWGDDIGWYNISHNNRVPQGLPHDRPQARVGGPMSQPNVVIRQVSIQYDGTNSAAIVALLSGYSVTSETGGVLRMLPPSGPDVCISQTEYVVIQERTVIEVAPVAYYATRWLELA